MAVRHWTGAVDGDWSDLNNWLEGAVPINADDIYYDRGTQDCDISVTTGISPASLHVTSGYSGNLGAGGGHLIFINCTLFTFAGMGAKNYIEFTGTVANAYVTDSNAAVDVLELDGGTFAGIRLTKGNVRLSTGTYSGIVVGYNTTTGDVALNIAAVCTLDDVTQYGGVVTNDAAIPSPAGTYLCYGGTYNHGSAPSSTNILFFLEMWGGTVKYLSSGTLSVLLNYVGIFNGSGSYGFTITDAHLAQRGTINIANEAHNIVVTNGIRMLGEGKIVVDIGRILTP